MLAIGTGVAAGMAVAAGSLATLTVQAINTADEMGHMAQRIGIPVESLSRLAHAANLANVSSSQLETGLKQFARSLHEAATDPASKAARAFMSMGVSIKDATGNLIPAEQIILSLSDKFRSYKDTIEQTALAQTLFGKSGADMIPFLNEGSSAIQKAGSEANVVTESMAKQANLYKDNIDRLKTSLKQFGFAVASEVLPSLASLSTVLADNATKMADNERQGGFVAKSFQFIAKNALTAAHGVEVLRQIFTLSTWQETEKQLDAIAAKYERLVMAATGPQIQGLKGPPGRGALMGRSDGGGSSESGVGATTAPLVAADILLGPPIESFQRYQEQLALLGEFYDQAKVKQSESIKDRLAKEQRAKDTLISTTGQMFGTMARLSATFGAKNFALQQAFQIGQAIMNTSLAVTRALAAADPPLNFVLAGMVAAMGAAEIAIISASKPGGQAHSGMTSIPADSSWYLQGGERVIARNQNADLTQFLSSQNSGGTFNLVLDGQVIASWIREGTRDGRIEINRRSINPKI